MGFKVEKLRLTNTVDESRAIIINTAMVGLSEPDMGNGDKPYIKVVISYCFIS